MLSPVQGPLPYQAPTPRFGGPKNLPWGGNQDPPTCNHAGERLGTYSSPKSRGGAICTTCDHVGTPHPGMCNAQHQPGSCQKVIIGLVYSSTANIIHPCVVDNKQLYEYALPPSFGMGSEASAVRSTPTAAGTLLDSKTTGHKWSH
jgi:hypothetical protein